MEGGQLPSFQPSTKSGGPLLAPAPKFKERGFAPLQPAWLLLKFLFISCGPSYVRRLYLISNSQCALICIISDQRLAWSQNFLGDNFACVDLSYPRPQSSFLRSFDAKGNKETVHCMSDNPTLLHRGRISDTQKGYHVIRQFSNSIVKNSFMSDN